MKKTDRDAVIDAALTLFRMNGYHNTSMADISASCGLLKGSIYHYFPGKKELAIAALDQSGQLYATAFTAADWSARVAAVRNGFGYLVAPIRLADETIKAAREHFLPALPPFDIGVFIRPDAGPHQFARVLDILVEAVRNPIAVCEPVVPPRRRERASAFVMESQKL